MKAGLAFSAVGLALAATGADAKIFFQEDFSKDGWADRWVQSTWKESDGSQGNFDVTSGKFSDKKGLYSPQDARFYAASASFEPFTLGDKTTYIQYSAKYEQDIDCGGGYIKLGPKMEDQKTFGDPTTYNIMFGPDKCGYTSRTHLIFNYDGENKLKKTDLPYKQGTDAGVSHLYRLIIKPDNTVEVEVDKENIYKGKMEEDWELLPEKEIDDPEDKKPEDWVDEEMMDDPEDKKPEDWVEEEKISDPDATKPEEWNDEDDGEWSAPMIDNPKYKGPWSAKKIKNPEYKGVWAPKKIANPKYTADDRIHALKDKEFGWVGLDLWQLKAQSIFDNFMITDDLAEADKAADAWSKVQEEEKKGKEAADEVKKAEEKAKEGEKKDDDDDKDIDADDDDDDEKDL